MAQELVSVVMPCFNDGEYIEESVQSVLNQTYPQIELIIIDDGSDDSNTVAVLTRLREERKCTLLHTDHQGVSSARNHGIRHAKGKYILPVDSDDLIEPLYVEKAVEALEEDSQRGAVYCHADLFGELSGKWDLPDYSFDQMLRDNIVFITAMFYKDDWKAVGGFNENMTCGMEDYDFWIGILELGREIYQLPETFFHYRIKNKSRTTQLMQSEEKLKRMYQLIYQNHPTFYEKYRDEYAMQLRDALIEQILLRRKLEENNEVYQKITQIPWLKKLIKKVVKGK